MREGVSGGRGSERVRVSSYFYLLSIRYLSSFIRMEK
jgi:hypothetical protein